VGAAIIGWLLLGMMGGCTTVRPPQSPLSPTTIYLTEKTIHSSLVLPTGDGRYVEYAPGDWTFAALDQRDIFHAMGALFFSQQAALGRRYLAINPKSPGDTAELEGYAITPIVVEQAKVTALLKSLAERFGAGRTPRLNHNDHFLWVAVRGHYWMGNNCNTLAKASLARLGCVVRSGSVFAMYRMEPERAR
jgi:hypothetical protein